MGEHYNSIVAELTAVLEDADTSQDFDIRLPPTEM